MIKVWKKKQPWSECQPNFQLLLSNRKYKWITNNQKSSKELGLLIHTKCSAFAGQHKLNEVRRNKPTTTTGSISFVKQKTLDIYILLFSSVCFSHQISLFFFWSRSDARLLGFPELFWISERILTVLWSGESRFVLWALVFAASFPGF